MKNSKLFPFERNKYYYGKLLSVNDFEMEQKYTNDKRRLNNRLLYGSGIVAGMYVLAVDDFSISVERGLALDYSGREIVIDNPVIKKLSLIEDYDVIVQNQQNVSYVYLCLEYAEENTEPVHNVAGNNTAVSSVEYNKIKENYRLFLTDNEPETDHLSPRDLYTDTQTIYWGNGIRIRQSLSRFAGSGQGAQLKIQIENMGQQQLFAFSYDLMLKCMSYEGKSSINVSFNEALYDRAGRYELTYLLDVHDVIDVEGVAEMEEDSFMLSVEQRKISAKAQVRQTIHIAAASEMAQMVNSYYQENMETFLRNNYQQSIYLAKISLIQAGETYVIQNIENVPFGQYVAGSELTAAMMELMMQSAGSTSAAGILGDTKDSGKGGAGDSGMNFAQGEVTISLGGGAVRGRRFFSNEIVHGLGVGQATIILGIVDDENKELFGSSEVFENMDPELEIAAQHNRNKGSFVIGVRVVEETMKESVRIHWTVMKDTQEQVAEKKERKIFIKPNVLNLRTRESYYLEAVCTNMNDKRLKWSVRDNCGTIDSNGMYTAPNETGVFEVTAQSVAYPELKASIFVIVREPEK